MFLYHIRETKIIRSIKKDLFYHIFNTLIWNRLINLHLILKINIHKAYLNKKTINGINSSTLWLAHSITWNSSAWHSFHLTLLFIQDPLEHWLMKKEQFGYLTLNYVLMFLWYFIKARKKYKDLSYLERSNLRHNSILGQKYIPETSFILWPTYLTKGN